MPEVYTSNNILFCRTIRPEKSPPSLWFQPLGAGESWGNQMDETEEIWQLNLQGKDWQEPLRWGGNALPKPGLVSASTDCARALNEKVQPHSQTHIRAFFTVWSIVINMPRVFTRELLLAMESYFNAQTLECSYANEQVFVRVCLTRRSCPLRCSSHFGNWGES